MIFQKLRSFPVVLFIPEGFLALILRQFWHEHPYSMSYRRDQALFDSLKVPHQVVDAVNDTDLHFSSRLSFFCEYLIILAQRGKNRSGD